MIYWPHCRCIECQVNRALRWAFWLLALCALLFALCSCTSTVTPAAVTAEQASFDTGGQNSGFIGWLPNHAGGIFTPLARDRYNGLIAIYGRDFLPSLSFDSGVYRRPDGNYDFTAKAQANFDVMSQWRRKHQEPKNK